MAGKSKSGFGFKSGFSHFCQIRWIWIGFELFRRGGFGFGFEVFTEVDLGFGFGFEDCWIWI